MSQVSPSSSFQPLHFETAPLEAGLPVIQRASVGLCPQRGSGCFPVHRRQFQRPCPKERSEKADASRSCSSALEVTVAEWKIRNKGRIMPQHMTRQGLWNFWVWFFTRPYLLVVWSYQTKYFWGLRQCSSEKWNPVCLGCYVEPAGFCWGVCWGGLPEW